MSKKWVCMMLLLHVTSVMGLRNNLCGDVCKLVVDYDCGSFKVTVCDCGKVR